ncbi:MAG: hypothetical protein R2817_00565 [Flavobacteriales bacterium]
MKERAWNWIMRFDTAEELAPIRGFIAKANEENLDKLELMLNPERAGNIPQRP